MTPRELRYVVGSKFILQGDKVNQNNDSDEQVLERRELLAQKGGETGGIVQMRVPMNGIKWQGLYEKNSVELYGNQQILTTEKGVVQSSPKGLI